MAAIGAGRACTRVDWTTLRPTSVETLSGATAAVQSDGSVLIGGEFKPEDTYTLTCETTLPRITAFRIEALPDASLPQNGPGRHASGTFVLSQFSVDVMTTQVETIDGRYVRIELPGGEKPTPLTLAEVQAFSAGQNVALGGQATQSSTGHDAPAGRAIDGNTDGNALVSKSLSYTGDDDRAPGGNWTSGPSSRWIASSSGTAPTTISTRG